MSADVEDFDVIVSGGGLVGASLAVALAPLGIRIALVEAVPFASAAQPSFDDRTIALSRSSRRILDGIGAWGDIDERACAIRTIHVSQRGGFGSAVIDAREQGVTELGHVVASRALGAALWRKLDATPGISVFCPGGLDTPREVDGRMVANLSASGQKRPLAGRLLVIADGARSALREAVGIPAGERSYGQTAIVGNVSVSEPGTPGTAWERFTPDGPLALLPFRDDRFVFVLARSPDDADAAMKLDDARFLGLLQTEFGHRLGRFTRLGKRSTYPLALVRADRVTAPRVVVVGNAAHGLHPVAGQGYNLGLRDVATIAEIVADEVRMGRDPGSPGALARYAEWRRRDQRNVVAFTDGLIRLFGIRLRSMSAARGIGLALFDATPVAKRTLARQTMGMGGTLTRLARGLPL